MYKHFLVTRFNVRMTGPSPERLSPFVMDHAWLTKRLDFFLRFCLPAVASQTNTNFTWLIYFDVNTPTECLDNVRHVLSLPFPVEFCFVNDFDELLTHLRHRAIPEKGHFTITTRLDNDDIISPDFIHMIQDAFISEAPTMINISVGYVFYFRLGLLTKWNNKKTNQFSSIIEFGDHQSLYTIYGFPHWKPPEECKTISILHQPGWIEMVHDGNNRQRKLVGIPVFSNKALKAFKVNTAEFQLSFWCSLKYASQWMPRMILRKLGSLLADNH